MNNISKFKAAYQKLNPEQRKAVDAVEGPVMVIAGPGTGKTQMLTMRVANILDKTDTPPDAILALTFTESAAASMKKRLADIIGAPAYRVNITTFHGFANSVIKNYPDHFPEIIGSANINEIDQVQILKNIIDKTAFKEIKPFGDKYYYLKPILSAITELKQQGILPEKFKELAQTEKENFESLPDLYYETGAHKGKMKGKYSDDLKHIKRNEELALAYDEYQKCLLSAKQYDYNDMIMRVMETLEKNEELRLLLQETYLYILVDEHQDTNSAQNRILELLASYFDNPNLFVVGDEKQAIYRFQGASLENFLYFKKIYNNVSLISLKNNYRSTQTILDASHNLLPKENGLLAQAGHPESPINVCSLSSPETEYYFISQKIMELISAEIRPEEIAVLYRENKDAAPLARVLEKQNIPFNIESDQDALSDEDIKKLLTIFRAVRHFGSAPELFDLLHIDFFKIPPIDTYKLAAFSLKKGRINPYDIMKSRTAIAEAGIESESAERLAKAYENLSKWKISAKNSGALEVFENIVRDSGFLAHIISWPSASEKIAKLRALFEHLKSLVENRKNYSLEDFFKHLELIEEHNITIKSSEISRLPGKVRLMTAHKSKGLEFEYVFIINAVDGKWGSKRRAEHIKLPKSVYGILKSVENKIENEAIKTDDEKNLFYVAITRAKKEIFITYSQKNRSGRDELPTQFIQEINENLISPADTEGYEKEYYNHQEIEFARSPEKKSEIKEKEFLNGLFKEQGLSPTALGNYLNCPWKYFYVNLIRIPESPNKHLMYGNAIHEALKTYFNSLAKGEDKEKEYLAAVFENSLSRQPIEENDFYETLEKGKKSLSNYYDFYHNSWIRQTINEIKMEGVEISSKNGENESPVKILGKIDKIEFLGSGNNVNVVDYKTGKPKSRNAIEGKNESDDTNYKRQLVFYNLLLNKSGKYNMVSGEIDFVEADEKGNFKKESFEIKPEEIIDLENLIIKISDEIQNLEFWDKRCGDPKCRYCELRKMM